MDLDEDVLTGRRRKRRWLIALISLPFLGVMGFGVWFFLSARQEAHEKTLVEQVSGAAYGCVAAMRGDAPEAWGIERALEHMSRMERVTRGEVATPDTPRFLQLSEDAARGCEQLGTLMMQARNEAPDLYFAVPAKLAQPPDEGAPERWFRRTLPESRGEVEELTRQMRTMQEAINARRAEHGLMPTALPIEGRGNTELARLVALAPLPRDRSEHPVTEAWPLSTEVLVLRRGSIERVPCDTRFINRLSCYADFVQSVSWEGEAEPLRELTRPRAVSYWAAFAPSDDGSLWAVGIDRRDHGIVGRYGPGEATAETAPIDAPIDGAAWMAQVIGGMAVYASDDGVWESQGQLRFTRAETPPLRVMLLPTDESVEQGIVLDGVGTLSIFGSQEDGFTSRLSTSTGEVLIRLIDARSRVQAVPSMRALRSGHTVATVLRNQEAPDALLLSTDFGRSWLSQPAGE